MRHFEPFAMELTRVHYDSKLSDSSHDAGRSAYIPPSTGKERKT
jgi:hypothetical protein